MRENRSSCVEKEGTQIVTKLSQTVTKGQSFFTKQKKTRENTDEHTFREQMLWPLLGAR